MATLDPMASTERATRTAGLDGLRALAALSVLCLHVWLYTQPNPARPRRSGFLGHAAFELRLGLVFFFVLSGYLLYRAFAGAALGRGEPVRVGRYARRRVARIVPAYWLSLVGALALLWGARGEPGVRLPSAGGLPLFLVFGQNYSQATFLRLNPVTWTLCLEAAFYVLLPLIGLVAYRFARGSAGRQAAVPAALVVVGLGYSAMVHFGGWSDMAGKALPAYLPTFACGMLVSLWAERRRVTATDAQATAPRASLSPRETAALVGGGLALTVADAFWHATTPARDALLSVVGDLPAAAGFAVIVAAAVAGSGAAVDWMRVRPLAWVGVVSYGVYLWNVPVILFVRSNRLLPSGFVPALATVLPPVLAVSAASWYLVERPLLARLTRPARRRARGPRRAPDPRRVPSQPVRARELEAHAAP